ncbi:hypothetical protein HB162lentus_01020 [Mammaliicoccus lentus]
MYKYNITLEGEQNFTEEDLYNMLEDRVEDGVLCIRNWDGNSTIIKSKVKIKIIKNPEQLKYK